MSNLVFRNQRMLALLLALLLITVALLEKNTLQATQQLQHDLLTQLKNAPRLTTRDLGSPVKTTRRGLLLWAANPDGKTWDLLQIYFPAYGGPNTIVVIDLGTGQIKQIQTERGLNFHLCPSVQAPNGKLFISLLNSWSRQQISIYDPATNELILDAVTMPNDILGETHPLVLGTDNKLYAIGQHPNKAATATQIDPDTLGVTAYGPMGPSHTPNSAWGYSGAADDRYIYIASGKIPWYLVVYDRKTKQSATLVETGTVGGNVSVSQRLDGCFGSASGIVNTDGRRMDYWLYQGQAIPVDPQHKNQPPWPPREPLLSPPARPEVNTDFAVPDAKGDAEIWVRTAEAKTRIPADTPADAPPEQRGWQRFRFRVPLYAQNIYRLLELPDGRIFGTAGAYEGNFVYDPISRRSEHLGKIQLSHYATTLANDKIYLSGYPSSPLYVYDPTHPWTAGKFVNNHLIADNEENANPRQLLLMGSKQLAGTHKMHSGVTGADGKVYFGGRWMRDGAGGGLGWYDPQTGQAGGLWEPLSNYQVTHLAAVDQGRRIVISTLAVDDPVLHKSRPAQAALFFFDPALGKLAGSFDPIAKVRGTGPIVAVGGSRIVGWTEDPEDENASVLYAVDAQEPRLLYRHRLPVRLPVALGSNQQEAWDFRLGPDGMIWTFMQGVLVRIDPSDGSLHLVGKPDSPGPLAFSQGRVYLGGTAALRRLVSVP